MTAKSILAHGAPPTHIGGTPGASAAPRARRARDASGDGAPERVGRRRPDADTPGMHGRIADVIGPNVPRDPLGLSFVHVIR